MAIAATAIGRVGPSGDDTFGAFYDPGISGAGTDYSQQNTAQLSLTDLACSNNTTLTSATGGFTSAMIGNAFCLPTTGGATAGYYFMTARASSTSCTLDRSPGTVSGGAGKLGGRARNPWRLWDSARATGDKCVPGNIIYHLGAGSSDYTYTSFYTPVSGDTTSGPVTLAADPAGPMPTFVGSGADLFIYVPTYLRIEGLSFKSASSTVFGYMIRPSNYCSIRSCVINTNGADSIGIAVAGSGCQIVDNELWSGSTSPSAGTAGNGLIQDAAGTGTLILANYIHHGRSDGLTLSGSASAGRVSWNFIYANKLNGVNVVAAPYGLSFDNNDIDSNGSHGLLLADIASLIGISAWNNIFQGHTGSVKYGVALTSGGAAAATAARRFLEYNDFFNNTGDIQTIPRDSNSLLLDPQYTAAGSANWAIGTNLKAKGFPGAIRGTSTTNYIDMGAAQRQEAGGGGMLYIQNLDGV